MNVLKMPRGYMVLVRSYKMVTVHVYMCGAIIEVWKGRDPTCQHVSALPSSFPVPA